VAALISMVHSSTSFVLKLRGLRGCLELFGFSTILISLVQGK